jgi:hypothetical protein
MATNFNVDDNLIDEACSLGHHKTKKDAVTAALVEYVQRRKALGILRAFGTVDFDPKYDYKAERWRSVPLSSRSKNKTPSRFRHGV